MPFQRTSTTKPIEEPDSVMQLRFRNNLAAFVTFKKAFGTPVEGTPIPGVQEARAVDNVTDYQFVGLESLTTPYQRTHLKLVFFYV